MQTASRRNEEGFTLIETLVVLVILAMIALVGATLFTNVLEFPRRFKIHSQATRDARTCVDTIAQLLQNAQPTSLVISTPNSPSTPPPNSAISFTTVDGSSYTITWSNSPLNSVTLQGALPNQLMSSPHVLAQNVTGLSFTGDYRDPSIIYVSLRIDAPLDASHLVTVLVSNRPVRVTGKIH